MTEPEKAKPQVRKPAAYLEIPTPTSNGGAAVNADGKPIMAPIDPTRPHAAARLAFGPPEDAKDPSNDLIAAVQTVFRVVTAKIAHHEREAQRLREALVPFATHARQSAAPVAPSDNASLDALLRIADELSKGDHQ